MRAIVTAIKERYGKDAWLLKVHGSPFQPKGTPDLIGTIRGVIVAMEVKAQRPGESLQATLNRVTPEQRRSLRAINDAGGVAAVVLSAVEALEICAVAARRASLMRTSPSEDTEVQCLRCRETWEGEGAMRSLARHLCRARSEEQQGAEVLEWRARQSGTGTSAGWTT